MELEEYLQVTGQSSRRKDKRAKAELSEFHALLEKKLAELIAEGSLEVYGNDDREATVYVTDAPELCISSHSFPCSEETLKALQHLQKKVRLTIKMEILD